MSRLVKLSFWIIFTLLVVIFTGRFNDNKPITLANPFVKPTLRMAVEDSLQNSRGRFGIFIKNLQTEETYTLNENQTFDAGSLYKLWVMGTVFKKIQAGEIEGDEIIEADVGDLNRRFGISEEDAELKEGSIDYTIKEALEQMITISHNYAAFMLTLKVGNEALEDFLKEYGFNSSSFGPPKTTASDIGKFFEKLYMGEIVDVESSKEMLEILSRQKINDRIPKYLPEGTRVAHKTGDIEFSEHDGGIVSTDPPAGGGDYIIVVLSQTDSAPTATEDIAKISKAVYDYFNKNPLL
ncbi:serine hydrolase [Candidatus Microgenomates bacterium]|nr:serine hydrolase [Candidatus Microgenomates bacterium]